MLRRLRVFIFEKCPVVFNLACWVLCVFVFVFGIVDIIGATVFIVVVAVTIVRCSIVFYIYANLFSVNVLELLRVLGFVRFAVYLFPYCAANCFATPTCESQLL